MAVTPPFKIVWSPKSLKTFDKIIDYLKENFTDKEIKHFIQKVTRILTHISYNPSMFKSSAMRKNIFLVVVSKQTTLYYRFKTSRQQVELLIFWDNRQNPKKLKY